MFRREFTALVLLPFVGRLMNAKPYGQRDAEATRRLHDEQTENAKEAMMYHELIKSLTDRFDRLLKERISFVRVDRGDSTRKFCVSCFMDDLQNPNVDSEYLIPIALSWGTASKHLGPV